MATTIKSKAQKSLTCSVLTREGPIMRNVRIYSVKLPTTEGEVLIYKDHSAYITSLYYGELLAVDQNKNILRVYVDGGIVEVLDNDVSILAEKAVYVKNINVEKIEASIKNIETQSVINDEERKRNDDNIKKMKRMIELRSSYVEGK